MKRTQLYLDEDLWKVLHIRSRQSGTSVFTKDVVFHFVQQS